MESPIATGGCAVGGDSIDWDDFLKILDDDEPPEASDMLLPSEPRDTFGPLEPKLLQPEVDWPAPMGLPGEAGAPPPSVCTAVDGCEAVIGKLATPLAEQACHGGARLSFENHNYIHKVVANAADGSRECRVSRLRQPFEVKLALRDEKARLMTMPLDLTCSLVFASSGEPVTATPPERPLEGETCATVVGGRVSFKLRVVALSSEHAGKRFCLKFAPSDVALAAARPELTLLSPPLKSVTKLGSHVETAVSPPTGGAGAMPGDAATDRRCGAAPAPDGSVLSPVARPQRRDAAARAPEQLTVDELREIIATQRAQIELLTEQNRLIMVELSRYQRSGSQSQPN